MLAFDSTFKHLFRQENLNLLSFRVVNRHIWLLECKVLTLNKEWTIKRHRKVVFLKNWITNHSEILENTWAWYYFSNHLSIKQIIVDRVFNWFRKFSCNNVDKFRLEERFKFVKNECKAFRELWSAIKRNLEIFDIDNSILKI